MSSLSAGAESLVLRKWARTYRYRRVAFALFGVLAVGTGSLGLMHLAQTVSEGRNAPHAAADALPLVTTGRAGRLLSAANDGVAVVRDLWSSDLLRNYVVRRTHGRAPIPCCNAAAVEGPKRLAACRFSAGWVKRTTASCGWCVARTPHVAPASPGFQLDRPPASRAAALWFPAGRPHSPAIFRSLPASVSH